MSGRIAAIPGVITSSDQAQAAAAASGSGDEQRAAAQAPGEQRQQQAGRHAISMQGADHGSHHLARQLAGGERAEGGGGDQRAERDPRADPAAEQQPQEEVETDLAQPAPAAPACGRVYSSEGCAGGASTQARPASIARSAISSRLTSGTRAAPSVRRSISIPACTRASLKSKSRAPPEAAE